MKRRYKILSAVSGVVGLSWLAFAFLPWKPLIESGLEAMVEARGFAPAQLTLSDINMRGATLQDITIGGSQNVTLKNLAVGYSLQKHEFSLEADNLHYTQGGLKAAAAKADVDTKNRAGDWRLHDLRVEAGSVVLPAMAGSGKVAFGGGAFTLSGQIKSPDNAYRAAFSVDYPLAKQNAKFTLAYAAIPWKGGTLATRDVTVPLATRQPVKLVLQMQKISTDALLQTLTGKRVSATGTVSGHLPLEISRDGTFSFGAGALQADGGGVMTLPADAIPGDNEQVAVVRAILRNFHYQDLSIAVQNDPGGEMTLVVSLAGNNPDMYQGRPVKLNVRLVGDVLDYIRQNVLFLASPETMLKQDFK